MSEQLSEWGRGWKTVLAGTVGMTAMTGVPSVTGVVMAPLISEFGWTRAVVAANIFICSTMTLVLAPVAGALIARFGVRRVAIGSVMAAVPALLLIASAGASPLRWYIVWTVFAVVNIGIGPLIWAAAVSALFDKTRGMALAIVFSGGGLAFLIFPPLAVMVEARFSWRAVYVVIAAIFLAGLLPLIVAWFRGAEDVAQTKPAGEPALPLLGLTLSEALRARQFWQLAAIALLIAIVEGAMMMHLYPILREQGLAPTMAAAIASMMGLALVVGRLVTGALLDRLAAPQVFAGSILLILLSCLTAQFSAGGTFLAATMSILLGLGAGGTTNSIAYLAGRYFGLRAYASIFGLLMGIFATGYGIAPAIAGHVRDLVGSYGPLFLSLAAAATLAMLLAAALGTAPEPRVTA